jgi:E3 ubiquitin-protein ligase TRIP12
LTYDILIYHTSFNISQELSIYDILSFDPELGRTLLEFQGLVKQRESLQSDSVGNHASTSNLDYHGAKIEDLGLDFSLPGYAEYLLSDQNNSELVIIFIDWHSF